jgi:hypothetical protein
MQCIAIQQNTFTRLLYVTQPFIPGMKMKFSAERSLCVCWLHSEVGKAGCSINKTHT